MKYLILLVIVTLSTSSLSASEFKQCILDKYRTYTKVKTKWQNESTSVIFRQAPHLKEVAELYRDDQLARIEKNLLAVEILINLKPESIDAKKKLSRWLSLSNEVELILAEKNIRYKELLKIVKDSRTRIAHPNGDELRRIMRSEIMELPVFQLLLENFYTEIEKANQLRCNAT